MMSDFVMQLWEYSHTTRGYLFSFASSTFKKIMGGSAFLPKKESNEYDGEFQQKMGDESSNIDKGGFSPHIGHIVGSEL